MTRQIASRESFGACNLSWNQTKVQKILLKVQSCLVIPSKKAETVKKIIRCIIAPTIGVARVGDSKRGFFIGPESPGQKIRPADGFKDGEGRIKRQAARFRIFGLADDDTVVKELTLEDAAITWTVHLANRKAASQRFEGRYATAPKLRNADHDGPREALVIDPGPRSIAGRNASGATFDTGHFLGRPTPLGELRTDDHGRLLVLGGRGHSGSVRPNNPITDFANNDGWFDDVSDGPVLAEVVLRGGEALPVRAARVIVAPPDFAPDIENLRTLYEVIEEVAVGMGYPGRAGPVSFKRDVNPLLEKMARYQWVNGAARRGHGPGARADFLDPDYLALLAFNPERRAPGLPPPPDEPGRAARAADTRMKIFLRMRNPNLDVDSAEAIAQANANFMPQLAGDDDDPVEGKPRTWMSLLKSQYAILQAWANGDFVDDWDGAPLPAPALDEIPLADRPHALTRGALQACAGGPFYPGIEMTYIAQDATLYAEPFVLRPDIEPGGVTAFMAVPWQADFYECNTHWWPAQRPDDVITEPAYDAVVADLEKRRRVTATPFEADALPGLAPPDDDAQAVVWARGRFAATERWDRGLAGADPIRRHPGALEGADAMTRHWSEMGFVVAKPSPAPRPLVENGHAALWTADDQSVYVETERTPFAGVNLREFYYYLANIESFPEFLPKARWLVEHFLRTSWERQHERGYPESWRFFTYSEAMFETRMQSIYEELVHSGEAYDPADPKCNPTFRTRDDFLVRLINFAPFNQNDGAWLSRVTPAGPLDEIQSLLFSIWMDEAGDGEVQQSHCNIYTDLLKSVGVYLHDPRSRAYAFDPRFLDSAFAVPVLELAIAQFSQEYLPELLGFTLQLEWCVPGIYPVQKLCEYFGVDSHFYRLHIGIDNAADGHGAKAVEAIKLYLDRIRTEGGDKAMQDAWRRIWNGFLAFGDTGTMGEDLHNALQRRHRSTPRDDVIALIAEKARYGSLNHHQRMIGGTRINDWFGDPPAFLDALLAAGWFVPGRPDQSEFFRLTSFEGPMFKVFNDDELALWRRWTVWLGEPKAANGGGSPDEGLASVGRAHSGVAMAELLETLEKRQDGEAAHAAKTLAGAHPSTGAPVAWSVAQWFAEIAAKTPGATTAFMAALADPANGMITPGTIENSVLVQDFLSPTRRMGAAFDIVAPLSGGTTFREVLIGWIADGCPLPKPQGAVAAPHSLQKPPPPDVHPRPTIRGMGALH